MSIIDLTEYDFKNNRSELRKEIINIFLDENPGTGNGELTSRYNYIVKRKGDIEVYLKRPAQFNNGFDFTLNVSNTNFNPNGRATTRPTHGNIINDLASKKETDEALYSKLKLEIDRIYNCQQPKKVVFDFNIGLDSEILLECIKWLFLEQDVTYWNYSGRAMFYSKINEI
jgi:hypothetical protein